MTELEQLKAIAFASVHDLIGSVDGVNHLKPIDQIAPEALAACKVLRFDKEGRLRGIALHDKLAALGELLALGTMAGNLRADVKELQDELQRSAGPGERAIVEQA